MTDPTREASLRGDETLARRLEEAGVDFCLSTHHPVLSVELFHASACLYAARGVSEAGVLRAITETPARIFGLDDRVGKIAPGLDADLVVFEGDPFRSMSRVVSTMIDGETVYEA
jgi:imidazolonepropionase-like amidohydrolase